MTNVRQKKWNLHAELSALYQHLDASVEAYDREPSDENRATIVRYEEEIAAKELELAQIRELEQTESGVGGDKPPGRKYAPPLEGPPEGEESGESNERLRRLKDADHLRKMKEFVRQSLAGTTFPRGELAEIFLRELTGHAMEFSALPAGQEIARFQVGKLGEIGEKEGKSGEETGHIDEHLEEALRRAPIPFDSLQMHGQFRDPPGGAFTGMAALSIRGDFEDALLKSCDVYLDHLLLECISILSTFREQSSDAFYHLEMLGKECRAANWLAVREKLAVIKVLCKE